jgi:hypothetical protein
VRKGPLTDVFDAAALGGPPRHTSERIRDEIIGSSRPESDCC